jgi:hypothetical protein
MRVRLFFTNGAVTDYDEVTDINIDRNTRVLALSLLVHDGLAPRTPDRIGVPLPALRYWEEYD